MDAESIQLRSPVGIDESLARLSASALSPLAFPAAQGAVVGLRWGRRFVVWRRAEGALMRFVPHPALWCRLGSVAGATTLQARVAVPPDPVLIVQIALFAALAVPLFGWQGLVAAGLVSAMLAVTAQVVALQFVDEDVPLLERWLSERLREG